MKIGYDRNSSDNTKGLHDTKKGFHLSVMLYKLEVLVLVLLFMTSLPGAGAQTTHRLPRRKLIEFGWNSPTPTILRDCLAQIEKSPFDGTAIRLPEAAGGGHIFDVNKWATTRPEDREHEARILASLPKSAQLTDNFLVIHATSTMDWFRDADWVKAEEHLRWCARMAKAAGCRGVFWDPEPYNGFNLWHHPSLPGSDKRPFTTSYQQVRKRGAQFIRALQQEFPSLTVISLRQLSDFQKGSPFSAGLLPVRDPERVEKELAGAYWGLHVAFTNGILDAIAPGVTFVDGNEDAYFYTSALNFYRVYHTLKRDALALVAPENRAKYAAQFQVGHAVSVDYTSGRWGDKIGSFPDYLRKQARELTYEQQAQWFEHNVFHALQSTDAYVWVYAEDLNWWEGRNIPSGFAEALASAKRKHETGEPLGFDVEPMLVETQQRLKAQTKK